MVIAIKKIIPNYDNREMRQMEASALSSYLWNVLCSIKGVVDSSKQIEIILPLILYKRISDVFDEELSEEIKKFGNEQDARYAIEDSCREALKIGQKPILRFYIPQGYGWNDIRKYSSSGHLADYLARAMHEVAHINPELAGVLNVTDYAEQLSGYRILEDYDLANIIQALSTFRLGYEQVTSGVLSDVIDDLLNKLEVKYKGTFLTPRKVSTLLTELIVADDESEIYDPACGSGSLLIAAQAMLNKRNSCRHKKSKLYGQEKNSFIFAVAKIRMILSDSSNYSLALGDSLRMPAYTTISGENNNSYLKRFDYILSNPPWRQDFGNYSTYERDSLQRFVYGFPPKSCADWAWIQHILASLKDSGRAAVLLDLGAVSRGSNSKSFTKEKDIRRHIIESDFIESVIVLPEKIINGLNDPGVILILNRNKTIARRGKILLVNASTYAIKKNREWSLADEGIKAVIQSYNQWQDKERLSKIITLEETRAADFNLNPLDFIKGARIQYSLFKRGVSEFDKSLMPSVFMSHNCQDKPFVRKLANSLENHGVKVWVDEAEISIGESLTQKIGQAIEENDYVAVVLSNNSIKSEWVQKELQIAMNKEIEKRKVIVLPLLLEPVAMPPFLRDKLYADFTKLENFESSLSKLLKDIGVRPSV